MVNSFDLRTLVWLLVSLVEALLLVFLLYRSLYRAHPFFSLYVLSLVLQTTVVALVYRHWGETSREYWRAAWGSQAVVVGARWLAVAEIVRKVFERYAGIWRMVAIILSFLTLGILTYSVAASRFRFDLSVIFTDRALEFSIALFVVVMFVLARYYRLPIAHVQRQLAIGFCLYSCVWVINDSLFEGWRQSLGEIWDFIQTIAFLASVILWVSALRAEAPSSAVSPLPKLSSEMYAQLSQEVNSRLVPLNNPLSRLLRSEDPPS